jgi:hypothetical protein
MTRSYVYTPSNGASILRTPSPSFSTYSPSPSPYPLIPPPLDYFRSPYACSPLPPVSEPFSKPTTTTVGPVRVNPILGLAHRPAIQWDFTLPLTSITTADHQRLSSRILSEPATSPPRSSLTIISQHLPKEIAIYASPLNSGAYVTVEDVLITLHRALRLPVTPGQLDMLPSRHARRIVSAAYESRIRNKRIFEGMDTGVKRVDCLMGRNRFMGLSSTRVGPGTWALNVS